MSEFKISEQDKDTQRLFDAVVVHLFNKQVCCDDPNTDDYVATRALEAANTLMKKRAEWLKNN